MKEVLNNMVNLFKEHVLLALYCFVFFVLLIGVYAHSEFRYFPLLTIFIGTLFICYFILNKYLYNYFTQVSDIISLNIKSFSTLNLIAFGSIIGFIVLHYIYMNGVPLFKALATTDHLEVSRIRNEVTTNCPKWINYLASFYIKAIIPFYLFYFFQQKKYTLFSILFLVGGFYTLSLLQKSYIVTIILPLFIFFLLKQRWWVSLLSLLFIIISVLYLTKVANPHLSNQVTSDIIKQEIRDTTQTIKQPPALLEQPPEGEHKVVTMIKSLTDRVLFVPGKVVSIWFTEIPKSFPYLKGCGFNFLAPILNCEYVDYSHLLYNKEFPEYAKQGVIGSLVTASFMHDYANFGIFGLIISGIILALIFTSIRALFQSHFISQFVLNFTPVLILGTSALSTLLLSHGWLITLFLFTIYSKKFREKNED